jgi:hypothetical protein
MSRIAKKGPKKTQTPREMFRMSKFNLVAILFFNITFIGVPYSIQTWQVYDDALFIRNGMAIRGGDWLGPFDELTLVKGPGYPMFLALNNLFGLNVALSQALFWSLTLFIFLKVIPAKGMPQRLLPPLFVIALFDPRVYLLDHPIRETIYTSQALLSLAIIIFVLSSRFSEVVKHRNIDLVSIFGGFIFGWFWVTREEGYWLLPSIVILLLFYIRQARRNGAFGIFVKRIVLFILGFLIILITFFSMNKFYYGSFTGVDITEKNFVSAIRSLESIDTGVAVPYVSVTKEIRSVAYEVSPTFASLKEILDPTGSKSPWVNVICAQRASTCEEISNGFFVFALRQAADLTQAYDSPQSASNFFAKITREISKACKAKEIKCIEHQKFLPHLPPISASQWANLPNTTRAVYNSLKSAGRVQNNSRGAISGDSEEFQRVLSFLGRPTHFSLGAGDVFPVSALATTSKFVRQFLVGVYSKIIPLIINLGVFSALMFLTFGWKKREELELFIVGLSLWLGAVVRSALVILIDVSSFPTYHDGYLNASYSFLLLGSLIWITLLFKLKLSPKFKLMYSQLLPSRKSIRRLD